MSADEQAIRKLIEDWMQATARGRSTRRAGYTLTLLKRQPGGAWVITRDANLLG